ncbi:DNA polymerase family B-domain-containing protein [Auriculariales sp. MPI-PUGE-AT-0066]|nr:DNA polymerase family B-domain-containing protein [Auriculariales sp. MPI-PUGE-AT-0066]
MQRSQRDRAKPGTSRIQAYKLARESGNRAGNWEGERDEDDDAVYDVVTDEQYKFVVKKRLDQDDFIEDDGVEGYVDNGLDDFGEHDYSDESDREAKRKAKKLKEKAKAVPKRAAKPAPPEPTISAYKPKADPTEEADFMESLLSGLETSARQPAPKPATRVSRKRKQSADADDFTSYRDYSGFPSSDAASDGGYTDDAAPFSPAKRAKTARSRAPQARSRAIDVPPPEAETEAPDYTNDVPDYLDDGATGGGDLDTMDFDDEMLANFDISAVKKEEEDVRMDDLVPTRPTPKSRPIKSEGGPPAWLNIHASIPLAETDSLGTGLANDSATTDIKAFEDDGSFRFYWLDQHEADGNIHLIGKCINKAAKNPNARWISCCVTVKGLQRNLYVLKRETSLSEDEPVTDVSVYQEFNAIRRDAGIQKFKAKWVQRKYAFGEKDVPMEPHQYMKVVYGFDEPALDARNKKVQEAMTNSETIARIFGANTSAFELFVLKRKIKGPCWLSIKEPELSDSKISWTNIEVVVTDPKDIKPIRDEPGLQDGPPLNMMSLTIRTIANYESNQSELVCASARVWSNLSIEESRHINEIPCAVHTFVRPLQQGMWPTGFEDEAKKERDVNGRRITPITVCTNEFNLISKLLVLIQKADPDVIVGHDIVGSHLDVLLHRIKTLKSPNWSRIGRFVRKRQPDVGRQGTNLRFVAGRLVCDIASDGAKSMITSTTWSMTEMCSTHLRIEREDIDPDDVHSYFDPSDSSAARLVHFVRHTEMDAYFQMAIVKEVQILPLTRQLTELAGNSWNKTLNGGRAERNEYILLHKFHAEKYIVPDKTFGKKAAAVVKAEAEEGDQGVATTSRGRRDKFKGGLVFDPKRGLWTTYIIVMDFNSLYPSIIREYNIDFTTVNIAEHMASDEPPAPPEKGIPQGVLPGLIATYVKHRQEVKKLMKNPNLPEAKRKAYDIRQLALKLTANSMYGCLGFEYSRFYARPLAALTTQLGRETLTRTRELAEEMGLDVVYGDTDSVFVNSNKTTIQEARAIADEFKKAVNKQYDLLEIDLDSVFARLLLLQKKKYAALKIDGPIDNPIQVQEVKGLDMKRREYCDLSKDASRFVLQQVLSGEPTDTVVEMIYDYLTNLSEKVREGKVPDDKFRINKRLGKDPKDYPDAKSQPHVQVALRMRDRQQAVRSGQVIPYIFCIGAAEDSKDAGKQSQAERAKHPDELRRSDGALKIDYEFYLTNQILPPVERLCDPIEGMERARLAECLGLDPRRFQTSTATDREERSFGSLDSQIPDSERFKGCQPFSVRCRRCKSSFAFGALVPTVENDIKTSIFTATGPKCPGCKEELGLVSMQVQLENFIRHQIQSYYEGWTICQDSTCQNETRMMGVYAKRCLKECKGQVVMQYSDLRLYTQLTYLRSLFDAERALSKVRDTNQKTGLQTLIGTNLKPLVAMRDTVDRFMNMCARHWVKLEDIFGYMTLPKS